MKGGKAPKFPRNFLSAGTYDLMMFPSVWSSLLMVNKQALGTLVSLLMVILGRLWGTGTSVIRAGHESEGQGGRAQAPSHQLPAA